MKAEAAFAKDGTLPDPESTDNHEFKIVLGLIRDGLKKNPQRWTKMAKQCVGVSEETTTGVKRLYEMQVGERPEKRWGRGRDGMAVSRGGPFPHNQPV